MKNKKSLMAGGGLLLVMALLLGAWKMWMVSQISEGDKTITVEVVYGDQTSKEFEVDTDAAFLRAALEPSGLIAGSESEFGLFVLTVDGVTADDSKQEWWCFTKGGDAVMSSVDLTPIADGDVFEITLTTGY